jgi:hypothetical protein
MMWKREQDKRFFAVVVCLLFLVSAFRNIDEPSTWFFLFLGASVGLLLAIRILRLGRKIYQAAAETLGVNVRRGRGNAPPRQPGAYEEWCARNGLTPFAASQFFGRGGQGSGLRPR